MVLEQIDYISGLLALILVLISSYVGIYIISKYRKTPNKVYIFAGISCAGLFNGWYPTAVTFFLYLCTGEILTKDTYFLYGNIPLVFQASCWIYTVTELTTYKRYQKPILITYIIISIIFYIAFFYFFVTNPSVIGELTSPVDVHYIGFTRYYIILNLALVTIGGLVLARELLKSESPESKLRAKFLFYTFITWPVFGFMDAILLLPIFLLIIVRIMLMTTVVTFYFGFFLPKPMKKLFLKEN